ncbi:hypothetical protein PNP83_00890, partial [Halobacterium salinarum]|nr:hypothetical protein [Halobacterium salinarum]
MARSYRNPISEGLANSANVLDYMIGKFQDVVYKANNIYFSSKYGEGAKVVEKDWDNLIILDACRYDYFKNANSTNIIEGELGKSVSRGSHSREFMEKN